MLYEILWTTASCAAALVGIFALTSAPAVAQTYPAQQIRIICPFPAGGGTDLTARLLGEHLNKSLGQAIVVDNRTGASGMIGTGAVAKAPPDGYTLLVASGEMAVNPHMYKPMAYDIEKDLQPITLLVKVPNVLAVHADVPVKTVEELVAHAKQQPGKLTFSTSGVGNPQQLNGELFNKMAGVKILHIPYKGAAPQLADLAGKHVTMTFVSIGAAHAVHRKRSHPPDRRHVVDARVGVAGRTCDCGHPAAYGLRGQLLRLPRAGRAAGSDPEEGQCQPPCRR